MIQNQNADDPIVTAELSRCNAILGRDPDTLDGLLADDFLYTHGSGRTEGKDAYIKGVTSGKVGYAGFERTDLVVRHYPGTAVMTGTIHMSFISDGATKTLPYRFSSVWVASQSRWRLVAWHNTPLPA